MRYLSWPLWLVISIIAASPAAQALCIYKGKLYAKTTVPEEFHDSQWVIRAKVIAENDHCFGYDPCIIYDLQVLTRFKGSPPAHIRIFTSRDSGGFYLDKGVEYLLFLGPIDTSEEPPAAAQGAMEVNYNCGQSEAWREVSPAEQNALSHLTQQHN